MPKKYFHIVSCPLSKRQRFLYEDYIGRRKTKELLSSGSFLSMMGVLMQLRKVCNHPDLFETRPITTPFICESLSLPLPRLVSSMTVSSLCSHALNRSYESSDLSDEALEEADWRRSLRVFPQDCRRVFLGESLCDLETESQLAVACRRELEPKSASFVEDVLRQQVAFSPFSELQNEVEKTCFNYRYGLPSKRGIFGLL